MCASSLYLEKKRIETQLTRIVVNLFYIRYAILCLSLLLTRLSSKSKILRGTALPAFPICMFFTSRHACKIVIKAHASFHLRNSRFNNVVRTAAAFAKSGINPGRLARESREKSFLFFFFCERSATNPMYFVSELRPYEYEKTQRQARERF